MQDRRKTVVVVVVAMLLAAYVGSYFHLRMQRELVRTGLLYNVRLPDGRLGEGGGWCDSGVQRPAGSVGGAWMESVYRPLIAAESLFWNTLGRRLRTDV
jgi:hypothetical protein